MSLAVPGEVSSLPVAVEDQIKASVFQFEKRFADLGLLPVARMNGWIDDFKAELVKVAMVARAK